MFTHTTSRLQLPSRLRARLRSAYTLAELMIAIGVLGIGMVMAAALFPLGLRENQEAARLTIGSMVVDNGMAISQMTIHQVGFGGDSNTTPAVAMTNVLTPLLQASTCRKSIDQYPVTDSSTADPNNRYGFVTLGRNTNYENPSLTPTASTMQNQLVVVAYERMRSSTASTVFCTNKNSSGTALQYTLDPTDFVATSAFYGTPRFTATNMTFDMPPGAVLIDANTGRYAQVARYTWNSLTKVGSGALDRRMNFFYYPTNANFYTVMESDSSGSSSSWRTVAPIGIRASTVYLAP